MFLCFFGGAAITYSNTHGTTFQTTGAVTFRYIGTELTAAGSSVTMDGTPSARATWIGFLFRLQPTGSGNTLSTVNGLTGTSIKTIQTLARASVKTYDGLTPP
jgi:hypothetical protein